MVRFRLQQPFPTPHSTPEAKVPWILKDVDPSDPSGLTMHSKSLKVALVEVFRCGLRGVSTVVVPCVADGSWSRDRKSPEPIGSGMRIGGAVMEIRTRELPGTFGPARLPVQ